MSLISAIGQLLSMEAPILRWSQRSFKNHSLVSENGCLGMHSGIRVLSYIACLRRSFPLSFIPLEPYPARFARHLPHAGKALSVGDSAFPIQPPPLRGTSFHRKEGVSTRAPSLGRGCRAQRGGVGFLFWAAKPPPLFLPLQGRRCVEKSGILVS